MKLGYVGLSDGHRSKSTQTKAQIQSLLADRLGFATAYFPQMDPFEFSARIASETESIKVTLDATAFSSNPLSDIERDVKRVNARLAGRLCLGLEMCSPDASPKRKVDAQVLETLFSQDDHSSYFPVSSRFPMKPPRPEIVGLPITGSSVEARLAAARGYAPMTPSWLAEKDLAHIWPNMVAGATSALQRACPSHWQVNRVVVVHDDRTVLDSYLFGAQSPIRRYFERLARRGIIKGDVETAIGRAVISGSAQKVAEDILFLREIVGHFGTLNLVDPGAGDTTLTKKTMVQMAEDIVPMVASSDVGHLKSLERT